MNVLCLQGSPRKSGSTGKMLGWVEEELEALGHDVKHIDVGKEKIGGCVGCYKCQKDPDELVCAVDDKGLKILKRIAKADAVIYATPLYCWGFTAQFKALIDRHLCFVTGYMDPSTHKSHLEGKRAALLVTCGGPAGEGNTDTVSEVFRRMTDFLQCELAAELIVPGCVSPKTLGKEQEEQAKAFAAEVVG